MVPPKERTPFVNIERSAAGVSRYGLSLPRLFAFQSPFKQKGGLQMDIRHPKEQIQNFKSFLVDKPVFRRREVWPTFLQAHFQQWYTPERGLKAAEDVYWHSFLRRVSFDSGSRKRIIYPVRLPGGEWIHVAVPLVDREDPILSSIVFRRVQSEDIEKAIPELQAYYQYFLEYGEPIAKVEDGKVIRKTDEVEV
ncbi:hypothetical protein [Alicyclobacillus acidocaldarius]|nr:hypothetical protein [Alicyclobacillus acidocaldarius]